LLPAYHTCTSVAHPGPAPPHFLPAVQPSHRARRHL